MSSTPVFDAASISITSRLLSEVVDLHDSQFPHGSQFFLSLFLQLILIAISLAVVVFPTPLTPVRIYA